MSSFRERQAARLSGSGAAVRQWVRLGLDPGSPVDIFGTIERERVWLLFEPLQGLFGFFRREGDAGGIVLHSGHPLSVQRFTAAHEYGHFVLGHEASIDSRSELFGMADLPLQELEAQAFAAEFLMPLSLVNRALDRLSFAREPRDLTAIEAYQLALEIGSSYRATVTQLHQLNKIAAPDYDRLIGERPIDVKIELGQGERPADSRADVWLVDHQLGNRRPQLRLGDELHVWLPEIPTSGYRWEAALDRADGLELLDDGYEPGELETAERFGRARKRHLWWRAVGPGSGELDLRLLRAWERDGGEVLDALSVPFWVEAPRTGLDSSAGLSVPQREAMLRELA